jgi:ribosome-associated protein
MASTHGIEAAREFAIETARLAASTRCRDVVVLEVAELCSVTDFFVMATGSSPRQMRTVCDKASELGGQGDFKPFSQAGYKGESWILVDFIDVVLHVFSEQARQYYDLDSLWGDARKVPWEMDAQKA